LRVIIGREEVSEGERQLVVEARRYKQRKQEDHQRDWKRVMIEKERARATVIQMNAMMRFIYFTRKTNTPTSVARQDSTGKRVDLQSERDEM
jgi:hypothetical protein